MTLEEDVVDYANAVEAAAVNLKHRIARRHGITKEETKPEAKDFDSLKWNVKTGGKGDYEQARYEDQQDKDTFKALQEILKKHSGFWQSSSHKYWFHQNDENTADRRPK